MIHFDFTVDEVDAENIINLFQNEIISCLIQQRKAIAEKDEARINYCNNSIKYYKDLKDRISKSSITVEKGLNTF